MRIAISKIFTTTGILLLLTSLFLLIQRYNPRRLSFEDYDESNSTAESSVLESSLSTPKQLIIQDLGISLPIVSANPPKGGRWITTYEGVSFLNSTPIPGNRGNSVLYGHNWKSLLGNLEKATPGSVIEIVFENGAVEKFVIQIIQVVGPNKSDILDDTEDSRLTIYTCTGFLDSKRLVVTALPLEGGSL